MHEKQHPFGPVFGIDIDGTLGDYHEHFRRFAEMYIGREIELNWDGANGKFSKAMGISRLLHRQIKLAYRLGGMKRSMPVFDGARELTVQLRKRGAQIWLCTTRPYLKMDRIDHDTTHWITRRAKLQYDGLLAGEHKYRDLVKIVGQKRIVAVLDDLPEVVVGAQGIGLPAFLRAGDHNGYLRDVGLGVVDDSEDALSCLSAQLERWKFDVED